MSWTSQSVQTGHCVRTGSKHSSLHESIKSLLLRCVFGPRAQDWIIGCKRRQPSERLLRRTDIKLCAESNTHEAAAVAPK